MKRNEPQEDNLLGRVPPQSKEAEQAVLGAMMLDQTAIAKVVPILPEPDAFYHEAHRKAYGAILNLFQDNTPVDILTVCEELRRTDDLEVAGGVSYIAGLPDDVPTTANVEHYANIVKEKGLVRSLLTVSHEMIGRAYEPDADSASLLQDLDEFTYGLHQRALSKQASQISSITNEVRDRLIAALNHKEELIGLPTGFHFLDEILSGLQKSDMITIGARPSMGKTSLALNIARNVAQLNYHVLIFSLEMRDRELVYRLFASELHADSRALKRGYGGVGADRIHKVSEGLSGLPIYIDHSNPITFEEMRAKCQSRMNQTGLDLVIIDHLQVMAASEENNDVAQASGAVFRLKKDLDLPIVVLSQLSRGHEREGREPRRSDLRGSGRIEQDSDVILMMWNPGLIAASAEEREEALQNEKKDHLISVRVIKQRDGPSGDKVDLLFKPPQCRFEDISYRDDEPEDDVPF